MLKRSNSGTRFGSLTEREREVIGLAAAGLLDKQIGAQLGITLNTLRTYWGRIRDKVGNESRAALVGAFVREELGHRDGAANALDSHLGWVLDRTSMTVLASDSLNDNHNLRRGVSHPIDAYRGQIHPDDIDKFHAVHMDVFEGRVDAVNVSYRVVTEQGVDVVNATIHGVKGPDGTVDKVYGFRTHSLDCRPGHNPTVKVGHWEEEDYESEYFDVDETMAEILGSPVSGRISRSQTMTWKRHPEDEARAREACEQAVANRQEHLVTDVRLVLADGRQLWGRAKRRFEYQADGRVKIHGTFSVFE